MGESLGEAVLKLRTDDSEYAPGLSDAKRGAQELDGGIKKTERSAASLETRLKTLDRRLSAVGRTARRLGAGLSVGVSAPLLLAGRSVLQAAQDQENAIAAVEAALASMGTTAGFTSQQLQDMATDLQNATTFGDEEILDSVTANLLTFGDVQGEVFERAQVLALDLSQRLGTQLAQSALQLGRALNDPVRGMTALSRSGISFSDAQREVVKAMVEANDKASAQALILAELEKQFGGQAAAAARTSAGQVQQLSNAWGDFQEQLGAVLIEVLPPLTDLLSQVVTWLQTLEPETVAWIVAIGGAAVALGPVIGAVGLFISGLTALGPVLALIGTGIGALVAVGTGPLALLVAAVAGIVAVWANWGTISTILEDLFNAAKQWLQDALIGVLDAVGEKIGQVIGFFQQMFDVLVGNSIVPDLVDAIADEFGRLGAAMVDPTRRATEQTSQAFGELRGTGRGVFRDLLSEVENFADTGNFRLEKFVGNAIRQLSRLDGGAGSAFTQELLGGSSSRGGGLGLSSLFGGFFNDGGIPPAGKFSVVGERQPEIIFGDGRARVEPLSKLAVGGGPTVFNVSTSADFSNSSGLDEGRISQQLEQSQSATVDLIRQVVTGEFGLSPSPVGR